MAPSWLFGGSSPPATAGRSSPPATAGRSATPATAGGSATPATAGGSAPLATTGGSAPQATAGCSAPQATPAVVITGVPVADVRPVADAAAAAHPDVTAVVVGDPAEGLHPDKLRSAARAAVAAGILALLLASMDIIPLLLSAFAVMATLVANGVLITFASRDPVQLPAAAHRYRPLPDSQTPQLDLRTCAQAYSMVPVTVISVICLALYKADADGQGEGQPGRLQATRLAAFDFLKFLGLQGLVSSPSVQGSREGLVFVLHSKAMNVTMLASLAYLALLGFRAVLPDGPQAVSLVSSRTRTMQSSARLAFAVAVGLLVFAVVGFSPVLLGGLAFAVSSLASATVLMAVHEQQAELPPGGSSRAGVVQAHAFSAVTLSCVYFLGCTLLEQAALDPEQPQYKVKLRLLGFDLAFTAAAWFAFTLAVRAYFKSTYGERD